MTKYPRLPPPRTDLTGSTSSQQFEGSADELNRSILDSTKPYPALRQPDSGMKHYVIGFEGDARRDRRPDQALLRAAGARERYYFTGFRAASVYLPPGALAVLRRDSRVTWVDSAGPGDEGRPSAEQVSWAYTQHGFGNVYASYYGGNPEVRIAIIGDGVQCNLADFGLSLHAGCGAGFSLYGANPYVDGGLQHETEIASIIRAAVNNGIGIKGGAPNTTINPVAATTIGSQGQITVTCNDAAVAFDLAASPGGPIDADLIVLSWNGPPGVPPCPAMDSALAAVRQYLSKVITSAGNNGFGQPLGWPGNHPLAVAVGCVKSDLTVGCNANTGGGGMDLSAGGVSLKALNSSGQVVTVTGTSYAAPLVAAALALLYDQKLVEMGCKPHPDEALQVLLNNVQPPSGYYDPDWYGAGVVDVFAAVTSGWLFDADICPMM